ncbi:MAG: Lhr family helicase, partial [Acidimicrobiales bacterium]
VLGPSDLGRLPLEVVTDVADQVRPDPRDAEELHDLLGSLVLVSPRAEWEAWFAQLVDDRRALEVCGGKPAAGAEPAGRHWLAVERRAGVEELFPQARFEPDIELPVRPGALAAPAAGAAPAGALSASEATLLDAVRGHLEASAPLTPTEIRERLGIGASRESEVLSALSRLEHEGSVLACKVGDDPLGRYSARHLLMRAHAAMRDRSRRSVQTFSAVQLMRFLVAWQHAGQGNRLTGRDGVATVVEQLQGVEAPVEIWESSILPARVAEYRPGYLDDLCSRGEIGFGRLAMDSAAPPSRRPSATPSPATPIALFRREDLSWLLAAIRGEAAIGGETAVRGEATMHAPSSGPSVDVLEALLSHGALFMSDLCSVTGRMPIEVAEALWDGIAHGLVTADSFQGVRGLLSARSRLASLVTPTPAPGRPAYRSSRRRALPRPGRPRSHVGPAMTGGRWSLLDARVEVSGEYDRDELAEALAGQLLSRWGIVFRELALREAIGIGWRNVLFALRRLEARGIVRGGRFIAGFVGEQFALPEAYEQLRAIANSKEQGEIVRLSAADPLNLTGIVLAGPRVPAVRSRRIEIVDGMLRQDTEAVGA